MSKPVFLNSKVVYHDNSREYHIDARGKDLASIMRAIDPEDVTPEENPSKEQPYIPPVPREGDYNGVRLYIEERKRYDEPFKDFCLHHNRKELCTFLTKEFGWFVDDKSLGRNIQRNI